MTEGGRRSLAIGRYAAGWGLAAAITATLAIVLLPNEEPTRRAPVAAAQPLGVVARQAGCVLEEGDRAGAGGARPPTFGRTGQPLEAGVYSRPPAPSRLLGSLRRGAVVLQYRPDLGRAQVRILQRVGREVPGAIVTPDGSGMPHLVAATSWRRLLGCGRFDARALLAVRTFARRFAGAGASSGP